MLRSFTKLLPKLALVLSLIVLDQWTKYYVLQNLAGENPKFFCDLFEINLQQNTGIAFSLFDNNATQLKTLNTVILALIVFWLVRERKLPWAFVFVIAGGLGNLIDRYTLGYVVDFINPLFVNFAVFNFADVCLNLGVALLIIRAVLAREKNIV